MKCFYHDCYHSRVIGVGIYIETVTTFTDLLIVDVLQEKERLLQLFFPFYTFWGFESTLVNINSSNVALGVHFASLTIQLN